LLTETTFPRLPPSHVNAEGGIVLVTNEFQGLFKNGGIGTANTGLARALADAGFSVQVAYVGARLEDKVELEKFSSVKEDLKRLGIRLEAVPASPNLWDTFGDARRTSYAVYQYLKTQTFSVVYFNDCGGQAYFTCLAKRSGLAFENSKIVVVTHGPHCWLHEINFVKYYDTQPLIIDFLERKSVEFADVVVSPSEYLLRYLKGKHWIFPDATFVEQNIVNVGKSFQSRENSGRIVELVFFGRQEVRKGAKLFCDVIDALQSDSEISGLKITILGKFSRIDSLHSGLYILERSRKWTNSVRFLVKMGQPEAIAYLSKPGRLAIIPSLAENSPCVVSECVQLGIPFLATDSGGTKELIAPADAKYCLEAPNTSAFAAKLAEIVRGGAKRPSLSISQKDIVGSWLRFHTTEANDSLPPPKPFLQPSDRPLVSACLVHHNNARFLRQAFDSVMAQTYPSLELVIVDDGSTNAEALAVLEEIENIDADIPITIIYQPNKYLGAARNTAVAHARGDFFLFLDDDNVWMPHCVEAMVGVSQNLNADIVTGVSYHFKHSSVPTDADQEIPYLPLGGCAEVGAFENCYGDANALVSRDIFQEVGGFHTDYGQAVEDWQFFATAVLRGARLEVCSEPTFWYRVRSDGMLNKSNLLQNHRRILSVYKSYPLTVVSNAIEAILDIDSDYWHRNENVILKYPPEARRLALEVSRAEPNLDSSMRTFAEILLQIGFANEALEFAAFNTIELLGSTISRIRESLRRDALEAVVPPLITVEETLDLTAEARKRFITLQSLEPINTAPIDHGVARHSISMHPFAMTIPHIVPPGTQFLEIEVSFSGPPGSVEVAGVISEESDEVDFLKVDGWTSVGPEILRFIVPSKGAPIAHDLIILVRVTGESIVNSTELTWHSLRAIVSNGQAAIPKLKLPQSLEPVTLKKFKKAHLVTDIDDVDFAVFNPEYFPVLLHPVHGRISLVRLQKVLKRGSRGAVGVVGVLDERAHPVQFGMWFHPSAEATLSSNNIADARHFSKWLTVADVNTQFRIGLLLKAELDQDFDLYIGTRVEGKPNVHFCHAVWHSVSIVA
jgi:glycosyltransferase involved in cell wall biosynthesis